MPLMWDFYVLKGIRYEMRVLVGLGVALLNIY